MVFFNILVVLITLIAASYHDLKKKTVPSYVLYPIVVIGIFSTLITMSAVTDPFFRYLNLLVALGVVVIGIIANQNKMLGGADIFLFAGVVLMTPAEFMSIDFFLSFFLFSCIAGLAYYVIMKIAGKKDSEHIKFVPCILIGYVIALYGLGAAVFL